MRRVAGVAAVFALPLMWLAPPAAPSHPVAQPPVPRTIAGSWSILFGQFDFVRTASQGTFTDRVIDQRLGVFCPKVNDQNGQFVLHRDRRNWRVYTGTWEWFNPSTCKPAGYGRVSVLLWRYKPYAFFTAYPPPGARGSADEFRINRTS
jgi:hypothetical protein